MELFNTDLTPKAIQYGNIGEAAINTQLEQNNFDGLQQVNPNSTGETFYNPQDPQALKAKAELEKKANNGINFKPPSQGQMFMDMLGGMLIAYSASRLLGNDGNASLGVGLMAAALNHDKDKNENHRFSIINDSINRNGHIYDPNDLYEFMKTGNGKGMEAAEQRKYKLSDTAAQYEHEDAMQQGRFDNSQNMLEQRFNQQDKLQGERFEHQGAMQQERLEHQDNRSGAGALVDNDGHLTFHGGTQATGLANAVRQTKAPLVRNLQSRMAKLASAEGAIPQIKEAINRGDYKGAQAIYNTFKDDIASANKGGNASISESDRSEMENIGSTLNQWMNKARTSAGYMPNEDTMNAVFNNMKAISQNDRHALNTEVESEVDNLGGGAYNPAVVKGAASILMNQAVGNNEAPSSSEAPVNSAPPSADGVKQVAMGTRDLISHDGEASGSPEGAEITNGTVTLKVVNGKWQVQD